MDKIIEFDPLLYAHLNSDLKSLSVDELYSHYVNFGLEEGRLASNISTREIFCRTIDTSGACLEIGPFANPLISGNNVYYCDVLNQEELKKRAVLHNINPKQIPVINFVIENGNLDCIEMKFDSILSSHVIEHQPDLISHLVQIQNKLNINGRYYCLIPDKRYCFDRNIAVSTIADLVLAFHEARKRHNIKSIIEHRALTVHNDPRIHWNNCDAECNISEKKILEAIEEYKLSGDHYIDVHAWYFTPKSFIENVNTIRGLGYINLQIEKVYPTLNGNNEFWVVLKNE